jgi:hypothetical protein
VTTPRPCLACGTPTRNGTRCPTCQQAHNAQRWAAKTTRYRSGPGAQWAQHSRQAIAHHLATNGPTCPGYNTPPHPATDWVTDHDLGPLCRPCNSRKAATHDKQTRGTTADRRHD